jgi:predicted 3-demethylubiquinone-9 3-methyltransferase (glyoxalase superfamily)
MSKISPCLWFERDAEEAAKFYTSLVPSSKIEKAWRSPTDYPGGTKDSVLLVEFTLAGQSFQALNGGTKPQYTQSLSLSIDCEDQAEVDKVWNAFLANGGKEVQCGWITDRWGVSWQVVPRILPKLMNDPDRAKAARVMQAMMQMVKIDVAALEKAAKG